MVIFFLKTIDELQRWFVCLDLTKLNASYLNCTKKYGNIKLSFVKEVKIDSESMNARDEYIKKLSGVKKSKEDPVIIFFLTPKER
jgi:hypothetical protein